MRFGIRELVFVLVLIGMPAAAYFFIFQPKNQLQQEGRAEVQSKKAKLQQLDQATAKFVDLDQEIDRLRTAIELIEQKLPAGKETYVVVNRVSELAIAHDLTVKSIKPEKVVSAAQYAELPIKLTIEGDFRGFYDFLLEAERLPRITQLPMMELEKLDDRGEEGKMTAEITLSIFFEGDHSLSADTDRR
ncbi:MAG: type 4a pilus biogenesis protein PilO [Planctomycetota bacterium]